MNIAFHEKEKRNGKKTLEPGIEIGPRSTIVYYTQGVPSFATVA